MNRVQLFTIVLFVFLPVYHAYSQTVKDEEYGVMVVSSRKSYDLQVTADSNLRMLDISKIIPTIRLDLRYATTNNFMHRKLYPPLRTTWLRAPVAYALRDVQQALAKEGLGLKIFDAYRPYSVTKSMWKLVHDERYVADPSKGSGHNRGIAVDLTIVHLKTGKELNMGTGFDNFTDSAHRDFTDLPEPVLANRKKFEAIMIEHGFVPLPTEWWHFYWKDADKFDVLDLPTSFR
jgi:zinc D-Ala-D-Ala dipeptidase